MKKHTYSIVLALFYLLFLSSGLGAQTESKPSNTSKLSIENNIAAKILSIGFIAEKMIDNVLVLVTDQKGNTIFLDNRYRFKGEYKQAIDLKDAAPGDVRLQIINDEEHFNHNITMR